MMIDEYRIIFLKEKKVSRNVQAISNSTLFFRFPPKMKETCGKGSKRPKSIVARLIRFSLTSARYCEGKT
jgi:hypothetical protein